MESVLLNPQVWLWAAVAVFVLSSLGRLVVSPLRYAYWLRRIFGSRIFGGARWARRQDLADAGMTAKGGLYLGSSCGVDLYHSGEGHLLTIAGTGGGKSSGLVVPALIQLTEGSVIVTDPSGELAAMTARQRSQIGPVVFLNPFSDLYRAEGKIDFPDTGFNPMSTLDPTASTFVTDCNTFARQLMVTDRRESGSYWNDEGAEFLALSIAAIKLYFPSDLHTLSFLYEFVRDNPVAMAMQLELIIDKGHPALKPEAERFLAIATNESGLGHWLGIAAKVALATKRYGPSTPLGEHVSKAGFDVSALKRERVTVYIMVPSSELGTALPWVNMLLGVFGKAIGRPGPMSPVTMLIDEAPAFGFLPDLRTYMAQFRKAGLRVWLFSQTYSALAAPELYGRDGMKEIFGLCAVRQFFSVEEPEMQELVSKMAGSKSVSNPSTSGTMGDVGQPLIRPDEVRGLRKWHQIIFRGGLQFPIRGKLTPYFKRPDIAGLVDPNPYREA